MKKIFYTVALSVFGLAAFAQTIENKTVTPFSVLEINGAAHVEIVSYDSLFCAVTADSKEQANIQLKQEGDKLIVTTSGTMREEHTVKIGCKGLTKIISDGAASVESNVICKSEKFSVKTDGASRAKLMFETKELVIDADGASSVRLKGVAAQLNVTAGGASKVKAYFLEAQNANVKTDGSANAVVNVKQKLTGKANGASNLYYAGKPVEKSLEKNGAARISEYTDEQANKEKNKNWNFHWDYEGGFKHWMGIGLNFNGFTTANYETTLPNEHSYMDLNYGKSIGWNLNFIEHDFHIWKNYINLCTGLGLEFDRYSFKNKITLDPDSSFVVATVNPSNNYKKNVLKTTYINVPLFLEINTSKTPEKSFHIGVGAIAGYKMGSRTKQFFDNDGYNHSVYKKDDYNLNPFKVQAMAQIGYGRFVLFGTYALTTLFEKNKGPELYPFSLGLRIVPFD